MIKRDSHNVKFVVIQILSRENGCNSGSMYLINCSSCLIISRAYIRQTISGLKFRYDVSGDTMLKSLFNALLQILLLQ